jgi:acetyl-CoA/propionyl-CoA carboxylase biotin carboxyl carrier protein
VVSTAYDPMLGKVVAHAETRELAREQLVEALDRTAVFGLTTNTGFLRSLLASEEFRDATLDTAWLDRHDVPAPDDAGARALAGLVLRQELQERPRGPWAPDSFRTGGPRGPLVEHGRDLSHSGWSTARQDDDGVWSAGIFEVADGFVRRTGATTEVVVQGQRFVLGPDDPFRDHAASAAGGAVGSPMPGTVLDVRVAAGDHVEQGQTLGVVEAMKMELALVAPHAGTVAAVTASVGDPVALGAVLFEVTADE